MKIHYFSLQTRYGKNILHASSCEPPKKNLIVTQRKNLEKPRGGPKTDTPYLRGTREKSFPSRDAKQFSRVPLSKNKKLSVARREISQTPWRPKNRHPNLRGTRETFFASRDAIRVNPIVFASRDATPRGTLVPEPRVQGRVRASDLAYFRTEY